MLENHYRGKVLEGLRAKAIAGVTFPRSGGAKTLQKYCFSDRNAPKHCRSIVLSCEYTNHCRTNAFGHLDPRTSTEAKILGTSYILKVSKEEGAQCLEGSRT